VYAVFDFPSHTNPVMLLPTLFRARVEDIRGDLAHGMYLVKVHAHNGVDYLLPQERLFTYAEAVAQRLLGKVQQWIA
jgi:hypothetical protein